jgi:hypothetical protein
MMRKISMERLEVPRDAVKYLRSLFTEDVEGKEHHELEVGNVRYMKASQCLQLALDYY